MSSILEVGKNSGKIDDLAYWKMRVTQAENRLENYKLLSLYVKDLIEMWPTVTLRTLSNVTAKIAILKDAVNLAEK